MLPAVFPLLAGDSDVTSLIGTAPVRVYRHGEAPQKVVAPYVTWFLASGLPENVLDGTPPADSYSVQVDCWSNSDAEVEQLAQFVRDAIEPAHHMTSVGPNGRDPETMRYRIGMTFSFWTHRP
jgi:hypothetical protein